MLTIAYQVSESNEHLIQETEIHLKAESLGDTNSIIDDSISEIPLVVDISTPNITCDSKISLQENQLNPHAEPSIHFKAESLGDTNSIVDDSISEIPLVVDI